VELATVAQTQMAAVVHKVAAVAVVVSSHAIKALAVT
jgi:hypothetical protein